MRFKETQDFQNDRKRFDAYKRKSLRHKNQLRNENGIRKKKEFKINLRKISLNLDEIEDNYLGEESGGDNMSIETNDKLN